jgi:hypothetical protein
MTVRSEIERNNGIVLPGTVVDIGYSGPIAKDPMVLSHHCCGLD